VRTADDRLKRRARTPAPLLRDDREVPVYHVGVDPSLEDHELRQRLLDLEWGTLNARPSPLAPLTSRIPRIFASVYTQREATTHWATANGVEVVPWHFDKAISGSAEINDRPELLAALADLRVHGAGVLIVVVQPRLGSALCSVLGPHAARLYRGGTPRP
jgi:hypothetical protein